MDTEQPSDGSMEMLIEAIATAPDADVADRLLDRLGLLLIDLPAEEAYALGRVLVERLEPAGESLLLAEALMLAGYFCEKLYDPLPAIELYTRATEIYFTARQFAAGNRARFRAILIQHNKIPQWPEHAVDKAAEHLYAWLDRSRLDAEALRWIAVLFAYSGGGADPLVPLRKSLKLVREREDREGEVQVLIELGAVYTTMGYGIGGDRDISVGWLLQAREVAERHRIRSGVMISVAYLARIYLDEKEFELAIECLLRIMAEYRREPRTPGIFTICMSLGHDDPGYVVPPSTPEDLEQGIAATLAGVMRRGFHGEFDPRGPLAEERDGTIDAADPEESRSGEASSTDASFRIDPGMLVEVHQAIAEELAKNGRPTVAALHRRIAFGYMPSSTDRKWKRTAIASALYQADEVEVEPGRWRHFERDFSAARESLGRRNNPLLDLALEIADSRLLTMEVQRELVEALAADGPSRVLHIRRLVQRLENGQDELWEPFYPAMDLLYPMFRERLLALSPELNNRKIRFCMLVRLGLSADELAILLVTIRKYVHRHAVSILRMLGVATDTEAFRERESSVGPIVLLRELLMTLEPDDEARGMNPSG